MPLVDVLNHRPGALPELSCASAAASIVRQNLANGLIVTSAAATESSKWREKHGVPQ